VVSQPGARKHAPVVPGSGGTLGATGPRRRVLEGAGGFSWGPVQAGCGHPANVSGSPAMCCRNPPHQRVPASSAGGYHPQCAAAPPQLHRHHLHPLPLRTLKIVLSALPHGTTSSIRVPVRSGRGRSLSESARERSRPAPPPSPATRRESSAASPVSRSAGAFPPRAEEAMPESPRTPAERFSRGQNKVAAPRRAGLKARSISVGLIHSALTPRRRR
jgi:hypothetical protein